MRTSLISYSIFLHIFTMHHNDVIMGAIASQITSLTIVYSTICSGTDQIISKLRVSGLCGGKSPGTGEFRTTWWRHQMETFSALLALCAGNSPVPGEFPVQRPVTRSFDVFFYLCLNEWLSIQSSSWWFETPSSSLWCHCNERPVARKMSPFDDVIMGHPFMCPTSRFITTYWWVQNVSIPFARSNEIFRRNLPWWKHKTTK